MTRGKRPVNHRRPYVVPAAPATPVRISYKSFSANVGLEVPKSAGRRRLHPSSHDGATSVCDPVELDSQVLRAAEHWAAPVGRCIVDQAGFLYAEEDVLEREVALRACQRPAYTAVDAAAPADVLIV